MSDSIHPESFRPYSEKDPSSDNGDKSDYSAIASAAFEFTDFVSSLADWSFGQVTEATSTISKTAALALETFSRAEGGTAAELALDYSRFQAERRKHPPVQDMEDVPSELEKKAYTLHKRRDELSPEESVELKHMLTELQSARTTKLANRYENATALYDYLKKEHPEEWSSGSRESIEKTLLLKVQADTGTDEISFEQLQSLHLALSKTLIAKTDRCVPSTQNIAYLASMANETNRLLPQSELFTGEDFLRCKVAELTFLYEGTENLQWTLTFVEDHPTLRTIDAMQTLLEEDSTLYEYRNQIRLLDIEKDLLEEKELYRNPTYREASAEKFMQEDVKGGAIQLGLRYLAQVVPSKAYGHPPSDVIVTTDCDVSFNLGHSGLIIDQIYQGGAQVSIGSRRMPSSYTANKSDWRKLQSLLFNTAARFFLNVQVSDTQVGAKAWTRDAITEIHNEFSEVSMSFDVEMLRLVSTKKLPIQETGITWKDSSYESKTTDQAGNMLQGLFNIYQKSFPHEDEITFPATSAEFKALGEALKREGPLFTSLIALATDPKWGYLIHHFEVLYSLVTPRVFTDFINATKTFLIHFASGDVSEDDLVILATSFQKLVENTRESYLFDFILHEFPELGDVIELIHKNPSYLPIVVSMLFGVNPLTSFVSSQGYDSVAHFKESLEAEVDDPMELFDIYMEKGAETVATTETHHEAPIDRNEEKITAGIEKLRVMNSELRAKGEKKKIALITTYNSDSTAEEYVDHVIGGKMQMLHERTKDLTNIEWDIVVVDSRTSRATTIGDHINVVLERSSQGTIAGTQLTLEEGGSKAVSVQFGMNHALEKDNADYVGYIDFSPKIDILEITHLVSGIYEDEKKGKESVAIGSRNLKESRVSNKSLPFLVRSLGLNVVIKGMFPLLFNIADTQTGFKLFHKKAWTAISDQTPSNTSLAFDIELLQLAAKAGCNIHEHPIDFEDTTIGISDFQPERITSLFDEVLSIRSNTDDSPAQAPKGIETRLIGGGAENCVYLLSNGSIIKIPHDAVDPELVGFLKDVLFKDRREMGISDQKDKLITSQVIHKLLTSPRFAKYIPMLREWKSLNVFVMKCISSFENKTYKSFGYHVSKRLGKDLVVPFNFLSAPLALQIGSETKIITPEDGAKISIPCEKVFKEKCLAIMKDPSKTPSVKKTEIQQMLLEGVHLFKNLWSRGLYDLDTNFLCDTGYHKDSDGNLKLMVLDPGELFDDLSIIDTRLARTMIEKRYDFIELRILLHEHLPEAEEEILGFYNGKMNDLIDEIEEDLKKPDEERLFGIDQKTHPEKSYEVELHIEPPLPIVPTEDLSTAEKVRASLRLSATERQMPYRPTQDDLIDLEVAPVTQPYIHIVRDGIHSEPLPFERIEAVTAGSVGPLREVLQRAIESEESQLLILDAGSATRSSLLKYANRCHSKGSIRIADAPIYSRAASGLAPLLSKLGNGYVVLGASDEIMQFKDEELERISSYFNGPSAPGCFWCDLPDAGRSVLPVTRRDAIQFAKEGSSIPELASKILSSIPITEGTESTIKPKKIIHKVLDAASEMAPSEGESHFSSSIMSFAQPYLRQFLLFNTHLKLGGIKTPFLLIFKKEMLREINLKIIPKLPPYIWHHITWESLIVLGMKSDRSFWNLQIPPFMEKETWNNIYDELKVLQEKYNIDTTSKEQNALRIFEGRWSAFDDPISLAEFVQGKFHDTPTHAHATPELSLVSDLPLSTIPRVHSKTPISLIASSSSLKGEITIRDESIATSKKEIPTVLFYNVNLSEDQKCEVIPNHLIISIGDEMYSTSMQPSGKEALRSQMVYQYEDGIPRPLGPLKEIKKLIFGEI